MLMCGAAAAPPYADTDTVATTTVNTTAQPETLMIPPGQTFEYSSAAAASSLGKSLYDFLREFTARQIHNFRGTRRLWQEHADGAPGPYSAAAGALCDCDPRTRGHWGR